MPTQNPDEPVNEPAADGGGNASGATGERSLDPVDLARVRLLAADLAAHGEELTTRKVRLLLGCRNEHAVRLRAAVEAERTTPGEENAQ